jgi:hypothetical protein
LLANTTGGQNTAVGMQALRCNTAGGNNTALGYQALFCNTTAADNTALGKCSLFLNTTGFNNIGVGPNALKCNTTGNTNTAIGINSGICITTGACNVILGSASANGFGTQNNNIFISDGAGNIRIFVTGSTGFVGVNTTSPQQQLHVGGALSVSGSVVDYETSPGLISPGVTNVVSFVPGTTSAAFIDYVLVDSLTGTNQRVGTIQVSINLNTTSAVINEVATIDIGNTSAISFSITYGAPTWIVAANSGATPFSISYMVRYF